MKAKSFFSENIKAALKNDPPGLWAPVMPDNCIRLSSGYPEPALVPVEQLREAVVGLLEEEHDLPLHYLGSPKIVKLTEKIQKRLAERGIHVSKEELLITSGACQAIDLIARVLIDDETFIVVESPTYMEALEIFKNYTHNIISIPVDEHGLQTERLEKLLEERRRKGLALPRFLYTIPTFQNPTGTTMSAERRKHVLELAANYNFLILEDDAYGELGFDESALPLKAMDKEGLVIHVGSLSKIVAPGLRIGWIGGASELISAFAWFKKDLDHPFAQATMAVFLEKTNEKERFQLLRDTYHDKRDVMVSALEQFVPESVSWIVPKGGYFVWVKIPGVDTSLLLNRALSEGVSFIPGKHFFLNQKDGTEFLRLSFSYANKNDIVKGIKKLGYLLKETI